jgi:hypothetical protein
MVVKRQWREQRGGSCGDSWAMAFARKLPIFTFRVVTQEWAKAGLVGVVLPD